jgi:ABC-type antimicrobial peptide transport system permease subunit
MRRRSLRFAVLQAVGLSRGGLLLMILIEYIVVLFYGVFFGLGLGIIGARLYVPFYRLTEKAAIPIPPYIPLIDNERAALMALAMAAALVVLQGMVLWRLVRIRVFETLRLGTRE